MHDCHPMYRKDVRTWNYPICWNQCVPSSTWHYQELLPHNGWIYRRRHYAPEMTKPVVSFYWHQSMTTSTTTLTMVSSIVLMEQLSSPRYDYPKCWKVMHNSPTSPNHYNKGNEWSNKVDRNPNNAFNEISSNLIWSRKWEYTRLTLFRLRRKDFDRCLHSHRE